jgi:S1-C subfamily serine protease
MKTYSRLFLIASFFFIATIPDSFARPTTAQLERYVLETAIFIESEFGHGSGVVFRLGKHPKVKYVLTAHHVVADALENGVPITLRSRAQPDLTGVVQNAAGWHVANDVASVRLPKNMYALRALRLSTRVLQPSDQVAIYSFPGGKFENFSKTLGVIERVGMEYVPVGGVNAVESRMAPKYHFSNFVLGGSSGGMMVNRWAHLMGIVTHFNTTEDGTVSGGLGTPSTVIVDLIKAAMKKGWRPGNGDISDDALLSRNTVSNNTVKSLGSPKNENVKKSFDQGVSAEDFTGGAPHSRSVVEKKGKLFSGWLIFWVISLFVILVIVLTLMIRIKIKAGNLDENQSQVTDGDNSK